ncbi:MAG TPA: undecaprenyl-diphosphate phosphatase [Woeseiaceae bacterium]|nr:undecaprenyl-diphosphate phosphatase [Woeseiaceae bacterium]
MATMQIIMLAVVQGVTEFLPISSSGHLILVPRIIGFQDQGIIFDVAVHLGSLVAVCLYFRDDLYFMLKSIPSNFKLNTAEKGPRLFSFLLIATLPAAILGFLLSDWIEVNLRNPIVIASTLAFYGILMWAADSMGSKKISLDDMKFSDAIIIGLSQALALIPGTSRSGITMTAALILGVKRTDAARFSFLLSIPIIGLASGYKLLMILFNNISVIWSELLLGMMVSMIIAYLSIGVFMGFIKRIGLMPFALYRIALSGFIFWLFI